MNGADRVWLGANIVGVVLLVWGGLRVWKKKPAKLTTWLWFGAGLTLGGWLVDSLRELIKKAAAGASPAVGIGIYSIIGIIGCALIWLILHEFPLRKGRGGGGPAIAGGGGTAGKTYMPYIGLLAPVLLLATPGVLGDGARALSNLLGKLGGPLGTFIGA
jgi:hypothetical protein